MGNHSLRKQVAKLLRENGSGSLYRGPKRNAFRLLPADILRSMIKFLSVKPGDLLHDCDGFNHRVQAAKAYHRGFKFWLGAGRGWAAKIDQIDWQGGSCSCGCPGGPSDAYSKEQVNNFWRSYFDFCDVPESEYYNKLRTAIANGESVCDDNGIILPQFER